MLRREWHEHYICTTYVAKNKSDYMSRDIETISLMCSTFISVTPRTKSNRQVMIDLFKKERKINLIIYISHSG